MKPQKRRWWTKQSRQKAPCLKPLRSTYSKYVKRLGSGAPYFDISTELNNLFELPDLSQFPSDEQLFAGARVLEETKP